MRLAPENYSPSIPRLDRQRMCLPRAIAAMGKASKAAVGLGSGRARSLRKPTGGSSRPEPLPAWRDLTAARGCVCCVSFESEFEVDSMAANTVGSSVRMRRARSSGHLRCRRGKFTACRNFSRSTSSGQTDSPKLPGGRLRLRFVWSTGLGCTPEPPVGG